MTDVFVSWSRLRAAEQAETAYVDSGHTGEEAAAWCETALPALHAWRQNKSKVSWPDDCLLAEILEVQVAVVAPQTSFGLQTFNLKLAHRLGPDKLPLAVAAWAQLLPFLENKFDPNTVRIFCLQNWSQFLGVWAAQCAAYNKPLPRTLWQVSPALEFVDEVQIRRLLQACYVAGGSQDDVLKTLEQRWQMPEANAETDLLLLLTLAAKYGFLDRVKNGISLDAANS